jgi:hypothetical protein
MIKDIAESKRIDSHILESQGVNGNSLDISVEETSNV